MKKSLPARPSLEQLKKQAKDLLKFHNAGDAEALHRVAENHPRSTAESPFALADAQLVVAREYGFESWPKLKTHVDAVTRGDDPRAAAFLQAACAGNQLEAKRLLVETPSLAEANIYIASMLGEIDAVRGMLNQEPARATRKGGPKNWEPLLYASASRFHHENEECAAGILEVGRTLLANGADPNTCFLWGSADKSKLSALYLATCEADNPALARILLEAGANPNDCESIYHSAEKFHIQCLDLLAEFGANVSDRIQPWNNTPLYFVLGHKPCGAMAEQVIDGVRWLLEHGADPNVSSNAFEGRPIHLAASNGWGADVLELLLRHGADLTARRKDGKSAYTLAARFGQPQAMDWLRVHGAQADLTSTEEFFAACGRGDEPVVRNILTAQLGLIQSMPDEDKVMLAFAAGDGKVESVRLMLLAGMPLMVLGDTGGTPLHQAAWYGQLEVVKLLLAHRAPLEAKDTTYGATPLGWVCHGSLNCRNPKGDYPGIAEALIQAGAEILPSHSGTEEVREMMRRYGDPNR